MFSNSFLRHHMSNHVCTAYLFLGQGVSYLLYLRDNAEVERNFWSGFVKVECLPLVNSIVFLVKDICMKVIPYPSDVNLLTVVYSMYM